MRGICSNRFLTQHDHYQSGPGLVVADVPLYNDITPFSRLGHWPILINLEHLKQNKKSAARHKDLADLENLP
jgi:hypothetical protein